MTNHSNQPARLFVALDESPMGELIGSVDPAQVPPGEEIEVSLMVPPGDGWAIFVNPAPQRGPLILARDVPPDVSGALPLHVFVDAAGESSVGLPDLPGWFGN